MTCTRCLQRGLMHPKNQTELLLQLNRTTGSWARSGFIKEKIEEEREGRSRQKVRRVSAEVDGRGSRLRGAEQLMELQMRPAIHVRNRSIPRKVTVKRSPPQVREKSPYRASKASPRNGPSISPAPIIRYAGQPVALVSF